MTQQDYLLNPPSTKEQQRLQNQLEALRNSILGTNADILALMSLIPVSTPQTKAIVIRIERRLKSLTTLQIQPKE
jgi:uncharacterized membrane protein